MDMFHIWFSKDAKEKFPNFVSKHTGNLSHLVSKPIFELTGNISHSVSTLILQLQGQ
jgi:hypothetical protein